VPVAEQGDSTARASGGKDDIGYSAGVSRPAKVFQAGAQAAQVFFRFCVQEIVKDRAAALERLQRFKGQVSQAQPQPAEQDLRRLFARKSRPFVFFQRRFGHV